MYKMLLLSGALSQTGSKNKTQSFKQDNAEIFLKYEG